MDKSCSLEYVVESDLQSIAFGFFFFFVLLVVFQCYSFHNNLDRSTDEKTRNALLTNTLQLCTHI